MSMANRPFSKKRIDELEQLFRASATELATLEALENELIHRSKPRAASLLKAVRKNRSLPHLIGTATNLSLFDPPPIPTRVADPRPPQRSEPVIGLTLKPSPAPRSMPVVRLTAPPHRSIPSTEPIPSTAAVEPKPKGGNAIMSPEEACEVLQVTLGADWEAIEKSRREIVQKSHPDKVRSLPLEKGRALIEHARRANGAVRFLLGLRIQ
jgi:DnaJ-domain-containing protein 1